MKNKNYIKLLGAIIINSFGDILFDLFIVWSITVNSGEVMNAVYLIGGSILFRALLSMFIVSQSLIFGINILTFLVAIVLVYQINSDKIYIKKEEVKSNKNRIFDSSMIGCIVSILAINVIDESIIIVLGFSLYGFFDALTQPLFSHTVSSLDNKNRGKILGGIDTIILLSPSLGMFIGTWLQKINTTFSVIFIVGIFLFGYLLINNSKEFKNIKIDKEIV